MVCVRLLLGLALQNERSVQQIPSDSLFACQKSKNGNCTESRAASALPIAHPWPWPLLHHAHIRNEEWISLFHWNSLAGWGWVAPFPWNIPSNFTPTFTPRSCKDVINHFLINFGFAFPELSRSYASSSGFWIERWRNSVKITSEKLLPRQIVPRFLSL